MQQTTSVIAQAMQDRKSVRKYEEGVVIPREQLVELIAQATTAPSSSNLQPWRFLIIDNQEQKKALRGIAFNQEQVETSSAVIAVLADTKMYEKAQQIYDANVEQGFMPRDVADNMITNSVNMYGGLPEGVLQNIINFDAGLISMQIMLLAKDMGYDTVPMGGYDKVKFAEMFEIPANEMPVLLLPIGKAAAPARNTSRLPLEDVVRFA